MTTLTPQQRWDIATPFWPAPQPSIFAGRWAPGEDYPSNPGPEWLCGTDWHNRKRKPK